MGLSIPYYVYKVTCLSTNQYYFGYRTRNARYNTLPQNDLWRKYFTSSSAVKSLVLQYGKANFESEILFTSFDIDECYWLEQDLIKKFSDDPLLINSYYHDKELGHRRFRASSDNCKFCDKHIGSGNIKKHEIACESNPNKIKRKRPKSPCVFCELLCAPGNLQNHERSCEMNPNRVTYTRPFAEFSNCQFCGVSVKSVALGKHERKCGYDPARADNLIECEHCQQKIPPSHKKQLHRTVCPKARYNHKSQKYQLLCKYCNKFVGAALIHRHQSVCDSNPAVETECIYCQQLFKKKEIRAHKKTCLNKPLPDKSRYRKIQCVECFSHFAFTQIQRHERGCYQKQALSCSAV